jgi:hypothetical protein
LAEAGLGTVALRIVFTAVLLAAFVGVGRVPVGSDPEAALVRLAFRMVGSKVTVCVDVSPEELAALPEHMRVERRCRDRVLPYRVRVAVDGTERLDAVRRPVGDRPLFVQEETPIPVGRSRLEVALEPARDAAASPELAPEERRDLEDAIAAAGRYRFDREVGAEAGEILLVELDESKGALTLVP